MNEKKYDKIICDDYKNLEQHLPPNIVNLSIIVPSHEDQMKKNIFLFLKKILTKVGKVTVPGGICCLILSDEIDPKTDIMSMNSTKSILQLLDSKDESSDWIIDDKIVWVKSPKEKVDSLNSMEGGTMISFDQTPFSTIYVLIKKGTNLEPKSIIDRLWNLRISEKKKTEMSDFTWFIQPTSEKGYQDHLPKEIVIRLIMLFSNENDLVLDPVANYGIIAIASKILNRHYICLDKNSARVEEAKERIKKTSK